MMTYLMHELASTADLQATEWKDFSKKHEAAKLFTSQNIIRANTADRFSVFSWSTGLKSYTGYIASNTPDKNKIIVPYKANNTGNILGWYTVNGKSTNANAVINGIYQLKGNSYTMNGKLLANDNSLENNFTLYSTPGNAFVYMDYVVGKAEGTITGEFGGLVAISTDPFTKEQRTLYHAKGRSQTDGSEMKEFPSSWVNIDNEVGIVTSSTDKSVAFGNRELNSSIYLSKLYPVFSRQQRKFSQDDIIDRRHIVYYSNVDSTVTAQLSAQLLSLTDRVAEGWNGVIVTDPDSTRYLLLSNYMGETACTLKDIMLPEGAPVFTTPTSITAKGSTADFRCDVNHSVANTLRVFVKDAEVSAWQAENDSCSAYIYNVSPQAQKATVTILAQGEEVTGQLTIEKGTCLLVKPEGNKLTSEKVDVKEDQEGFFDITARFLKNPGFEEDQTYGTVSKVILNGVTYDPCYTNTVNAANSKWPQILPVKGWEPDNLMKSGSNFTVLYSMPYSTTMYCVSPSNVGNSASIMAAPAMDDRCETRCLSILNSWDEGSNSISQTVTLPKGEYKLKFLAQYVCPNEMRHVGEDCITTSSNNINYSLCGISFDDTTLFRYPKFAHTWEEIVCPFTLDKETAVKIHMGLKTTAGVGAANNTRLYIDHVRLYSKEEIADHIGTTIPDSSTQPTDVYNLQGIKVRENVKPSEATQGLPQGIYIINHQKVYQP